MTRRRIAFFALLAVVALAAAVYLSRGFRFPPDVAPPPKKITVGWQRQWATQGQVMTALSRTNIPALYDVNLVPRDFQYGPDLNEAALTGEVEVTNAGIVPVINLLAKSEDWMIIARQIDFLVAIVARRNSGIHSVSDLRGKRFGVPFGGGSHPYALSRLQDNGLSVGDGPQQTNVMNLPAD